MINNINSKVTDFLDGLNHSLRNEIEALRYCILATNSKLTENIKWNGPNYCFDGMDRITMKIQPITSKQIQIIFHCGAKAKEQSKEQQIKEDFGILVWKDNNRAVATFKNMVEIEHNKLVLSKIIQQWLEATV